VIERLKGCLQRLTANKAIAGEGGVASRELLTEAGYAFCVIAVVNANKALADLNRNKYR
jgi:hypothetical protein